MSESSGQAHRRLVGRRYKYINTEVSYPYGTDVKRTKLCIRTGNAYSGIMEPNDQLCSILIGILKDELLHLSRTGFDHIVVRFRASAVLQSAHGPQMHSWCTIETQTHTTRSGASQSCSSLTAIPYSSTGGRMVTACKTDAQKTNNDDSAKARPGQALDNPH